MRVVLVLVLVLGGAGEGAEHREMDRVVVPWRAAPCHLGTVGTSTLENTHLQRPGGADLVMGSQSHPSACRPGP